jgi:predicted naringenin-chalcone synthase
MSFAIFGLGTAVPPTRVTQEEATRIARSLCCRTKEQETWLPLMYDHTGIRARHLIFDRQVVEDVLHGTTHSQSLFLPSGRDNDRGPTTGQRMRVYAAEAGPLALRAARQAMEQSRGSADEITHLVTVSCTGFQAPGVDYELIQGLGLAATVQRTHLGFMGCHGALNGLRVARAFGDSDPDARVLLCAVELCVLHYHYGWDPQKMSWTIGDHGFEMTLSKRVPGLIHTHLRPWLESWLARHGMSLETVGSWAIHPGGPRILESVAESLGLNEDKLTAARAVFAAHGNMSSPTVLFIVEHLRQQRAPLPCVALGFGPGLVVEAVLFA